MSTASKKPTRALILVMMALVIITVIIASRYYRQRNLAVDPRIVPARELYKQYNILSAANDYRGVINLLDSIESIYNSYPHYFASFETGVLENNRAAVYLTLAIAYDSLYTELHNLGRDSLMQLGESAVRNSIYLYERWQEKYATLSDPEIEEAIREDFLYETDFPSGDAEAYLETRVNEIREALKETDRRLSVSYTNLGIVYRFREDYESAASCYTMAIELWEDNLTAENNLNILLGRPLKKRTFIQKMFPKTRD